MLEALADGLMQTLQECNVVPVAGPLPVQGVDGLVATTRLRSHVVADVSVDELRPTGAAVADAVAEAVALHVAATVDDEVPGGDAGNGGGDVAAATELRTGLDRDDVARDERGELFGRQPVLGAHDDSSLGTAPGGKSRRPASLRVPPTGNDCKGSAQESDKGPNQIRFCVTSRHHIHEEKSAQASCNRRGGPDRRDLHWEGIWTVGVDIEPGTYRTAEAITGTGYCYWAIYTSGTDGDDIIENDGPEGGCPTVTLSAGQDFENSGCGTFVKQ
jgi:hypothetical protein